MTLPTDSLPLSAYADDTTLPIAVNPVAVPIGEPALSDRAYKATVGMSPLLDMNSEEIYSALASGKEEDLRKQAAAKIDEKQASTRTEKLTDALKSVEGTTPTLSEFSNRLGGDPVKFLNFTPTDPDTVLEHTYALNTIDLLDKSAQQMNSFWTQLSEDYPELVQREKNTGTDVLAKHAFVTTLKQNLDQEIHQQGWGEYLTNVAPTFLQAYQEYFLRGQTPGTSFWSGLLGTNLEEQRQERYRQDMDTFKQGILETVNRLKERNPLLASMYLDAMAGTTSDEKSLNNLFTVLGATDAATVGKLLGKPLFKGAKAVKIVYDVSQARTAVRDVIQAVSADPSPTNVIAATGDVASAAVKQQTMRLTGASKDVAKQITESMPSGLISDVKDIKENPGRLGQGLANMLESTYNRFSEQLLNTAATVSRVMRIPLEQATEDQLRALKENVKYQYPELTNSILDISGPQYNPLSNTWHFNLNIGKPGAEMFSSYQVAQTFARVNGLTDAKVVKQGLGYYLSVSKPLDETSQLARDMLLIPAGRSPERNLFQSAIGWLITPENTMAETQRINRKVATYAQAEIRKLADEQRRYLQDIKNGSISFDPVTGTPLPWYARRSRNWDPSAPGYYKGTRTIKNYNRWRDLERVLTDNQYMTDPSTGELGYYFKNPMELEANYLKNFNRLPELDEINAYFAHKRLVELDRVQRNFAVYRNKTRLGTQTHTFSWIGENGERITSPEFDGFRLNTVPHTDDTIIFVGANGVSRVTRGDKLSISELEDRVSKKSGKVTIPGLRSKVKSGQLKVIELYDPETNPLSGVGPITNERVRYVITTNLESKPIKWDQVPRRGGGHFEYEYNSYIKQARVRAENIDGDFKHWYEGDNTVMPVSIHAMGEDLIERMNAARRLLDEGLEDSARQYLEKNSIGVDPEEFIGWFKPKGKTPARLSTSEPFHVVPNNKRIIDLDKSLERRYERTRPDGSRYTTLKDGTRQGSAARQYQVEYTRPRDAHEMITVNNVGTTRNPIYAVSPAKLIDPIPMMNRALSKAINSSFMDDYKISSINHWIEEAAPYLMATDTELRHAPFYHFQNPRFKPSTPQNLAKIIALKANWWKIRNFSGMPPYVDQYLHAAGQQLADVTYDVFGPKVALVPQWLLPRVTNPVQFVRSMVYHFKLGIFALPQLIVQNATWVTMAGITPQYTAKAVPATLFHQWSRINSNPAILRKLDQYMTKFGWKNGEWLEALREGNTTGFFHVGGEYVNLDNLSTYRLIRGPASDFLDAGQIFFKEGERNVRYGAWYAAFKEFRDKNPTKILTRADRDAILERADFLYTNMSRASASLLHTGVFSLMTQFLSYQLRLGELFFSKRLAPTLAERMKIRARLFAFNAAAFGLPTASGVGLYPFGENIRKYARDNGYVIGDNFLTSLVMEGVPAMILALITGEGDYKKGTFYNVGERYGNQGYQILKDVVTGDKTLLQFIGGAAGSVVGNMFAQMSPFTNYLAAWWEGYKYGLVPEQFVGPLKEIQSVNAVWHVIAAHNTGMWMSKNGVPQVPTSLANAIFMAFTGLQDQRVTEAYQKLHDIKTEREFQKYTIDKMVGLIQAAQVAYSQKDVTNGDKLTDQARYSAVLAFGPDGDVDAMTTAWAKAYERADKTLVDSVDWDYVWKNTSHRSIIDVLRRQTPDKMEQRIEQWQRIQNINEKRGEQ